MGNWKGKDPSEIRTEINVGPPILIFGFTLTYLLPFIALGNYYFDA